MFLFVDFFVGYMMCDKKKEITFYMCNQFLQIVNFFSSASPAVPSPAAFFFFWPKENRIFLYQGASTL